MLHGLKKETQLEGRGGVHTREGGVHTRGGGTRDPGVSMDV